MRATELHASAAVYLPHALPDGATLRIDAANVEIEYRGKLHLIVLQARGFADRDQRAEHARLRRAGCRVVTCHSLAEIEMALQTFGIPRRGRIAA